MVEKYVASELNGGEEHRPVYVLMMFENPDKKWVNPENGREIHLPDTGQTYEPGFYYELDRAIEAMHKNIGDIRHNGDIRETGVIYNAGFIIPRFPGLYKSTTTKMYFVWDPEREGFFEKEAPLFFRNIGY